MPSALQPASGRPPNSTNAENTEYREISELFGQGAHAKTIQRTAAFRKKYPRSTWTNQVQNLAGLSLLATQNPSGAADAFKQAVDLTSDSSRLKPYFLYNLAQAQLEAGQVEPGFATVELVRITDLDRENQEKLRYLRGRIFLKRGLTLEATREALDLVKQVDEGQVTRLREGYALLDSALSAISDRSALEQIAAVHQDAPGGEYVLYHLGAKQLATGKAHEGEATLKVFMARFPANPHFEEANALIKAKATEKPIPLNDAQVDRGAIGILLPLKGKFSKFGYKSLQAIELAFKIFGNSEFDPKVTLVIEDSGEEVDQALASLEKLVLKHKVIAVIGPLLSKGADQVARRAQELGVPLLTLTRSEVEGGDFVFQAGLTLRLQAEEIARHAVQKLGLKRFAIVYPRDKTGEELSQKFWDEVERLGGEVVGIESYNPSETDFRQAVDKLSGLFYLEGRQRELDQLAKDREENKIRKRSRKTEKYFSLKPLVDYDAVFVPDEPKVAGQILPTFAYRDVDRVKFLGTASWNSPEFLQRAQTYAENASFLDAFVPEGGSILSKNFKDKYAATFASDPTSMEAMAFDAASVISSLLSEESGSLTRSRLRDLLKSVNGYTGVTGKMTYSNGQLARELTFLSIHGGKIEVESDRSQ